ncbi:GntR family transcriptional regulator [Fodinicurvata sp. EGI_FJ10296]|uniref:GntR family transcriptional regulator n=1 Tax=Fodinicurvata sp. EGI_FJ10296 TaxID=3231908 RepID=UPI0034525C6B
MSTIDSSLSAIRSADDAIATDRPESGPDSGGDRSATLGDRVYEQLLNAIITGDLPPGAKIGEVELSRRFGVSRGPLREAIRRLEERRLVVYTPHVGARVVELSSEVLLETFLVREAMEGMAARLAAQRMSDQEVGELADLLADHEQVLQGTDVYYQRDHDFDFHYRIVKGARNDLIEGILCGDLYQLLKLYRYQHRGSPGRANRALLEHKRVLGAIQDRDADLAEILMRRHITTARAILQGNLTSLSALADADD